MTSGVEPERPKTKAEGGRPLLSRSGDCAAKRNVFCTRIAEIAQAGRYGGARGVPGGGRVRTSVLRTEGLKRSSRLREARDPTIVLCVTARPLGPPPHRIPPAAKLLSMGAGSAVKH